MYSKKNTKTFTIHIVQKVWNSVMKIKYYWMTNIVTKKFWKTFLSKFSVLKLSSSLGWIPTLFLTLKEKKKKEKRKKKTKQRGRKHENNSQAEIPGPVAFSPGFNGEGKFWLCSSPSTPITNAWATMKRTTRASTYFMFYVSSVHLDA